MTLLKTFCYRAGRGCTRADASAVARAVRAQAALSAVAAAALEELLYSLCTLSRGHVRIELR